VDTVLGVSMAPTTVRMLLVEGANADGVTVDQDNFAVPDGEDSVTFGAADQVISAILGTREGAAEAGYQLLSTGVTWSDRLEAAALRDALAARKVENVMLVSAFLAAAALAQSVGMATGYAHTVLLYVEPDTATLAVVDTADGSIADVHREVLPEDDDEAVAKLAELVSGAEALEAHPEGVLVVGSGVDVPRIKPALESATSLPLSVPEEPDMALARGAALASANAPLFESSTDALAYAQDPGTGEVNPDALAPGYLAVAAIPVDVEGEEPLAYSAVVDEEADAFTGVAGEGEEDFTAPVERSTRRPFVLAMSVLAVFVVGVMALVISVAVGMRPSANQRPGLSQNVVVPTKQTPAPLPKAQVTAPPAPAPAAAAVPVPAPAPAPAPIRAPAPAPVPVRAPAPAPPPPALPPPLPLPQIVAPPLLGGPPVGPRGGRGWGHGDDDDEGGFGGPRLRVPLPIPGLHLGF
jgi:hypothetical protein